jgi:PhnB protein
MAQLNPYLRFKGNCREAMSFYQECLGGKLTMQSVGESPAAAHMPPQTHQSIMHSILENDSFTLMGSDMMNEDVSQGDVVSLALVCRSKEEIETAFAKLSAGANITQPLQSEFFGTFGSLVDKYGFPWMFQYDGKL